MNNNKTRGTGRWLKEMPEDQRSADKNLSDMNTKDNPPDLYSFLSEKANEKDLFIGVRYDYINIYYMGGSAGKIKKYSQGQYKNKAVIELHKKYCKGFSDKAKKITTGKSKYCFFYDNNNDSKDIIIDKEYYNNFKIIKENIESVQIGYPTENEDVSKSKDEKKCQQWIINENNNNDSDWYYLDMEYAKQSCPTGRFDMIAISRNKYNGKYKVALVELKVGNKSFTGLSEANRDIIHENCKSDKDTYKYFDDNKDLTIDCGSGIVGHIKKFIRFLHDKRYEEFLKDDIVNILNIHRKLGLLNNKGEISDSDEVKTEDLGNPDIYIISYNKAPKITTENPTTINDLKTSMEKYLFKKTTGASKCTLEATIDCTAVEDLKYHWDNKDNIRDEKDNISKKTTIETHSCRLRLGNDDEQAYYFNFVFVDNSNDNNWNCLEKLSTSKEENR